ncbi:sigma-70 family RNA polymerase sigma factor [Candidatus Uhrbacteria bacterium]|nr:MAG: sigma-70 family RNA polymerase sigma factor [Candidatus Uhrbacteria bacterium]
MMEERGVLIVTDPVGQVVHASRSVENWSGFSVAEAVGAKPGALWGGNMDRSFYESMWKTIAVEKKSFSSRLGNRSKSGKELPSLLTVFPVMESGAAKYFFAMQPAPEAWGAFEAAFAREWPRLSRDPRALAAWIDHWIGTKEEASPHESVAAFIERAFLHPTRERFLDRETDQAAIAAAKLDVRRYAEIFSRYHPAILGYLRRRIDDVLEAEDLAQDVFIKAMNGLSRFQPRNASYKTYLLRIAHHELLNRYRSKAAERRFTEQFRPASRIDRMEDRDALERAVAGLGAGEQEILRAFYVEDRPVAEIAERVGKSENAVKLVLSRSRKRLRDTF